MKLCCSNWTALCRTIIQYSKNHVSCAIMYVCLYKNSLKEKNHDGGSIEFIISKPVEFSPANCHDFFTNLCQPFIKFYCLFLPFLKSPKLFESIRISSFLEKILLMTIQYSCGGKLSFNSSEFTREINRIKHVLC